MEGRFEPLVTCPGIAGEETCPDQTLIEAGKKCSACRKRAKKAKG